MDTLTASLLFFEKSLNMTMILDYLGTFAFAIPGVRLSSGKDIDLFGAFVVGLLTAVGGGTLRDVMLGLTPFWLLTPTYMLISLVAFVLVVLFNDLIQKLTQGVFLFDAIGLGLFTVVGIERALMMGHPAWVAVMMGVITGSFGGLLRDICINEVPLIFRKDIYAVASLVGGLIYFLLWHLGASDVIVQTFTALSVILARVLCMYYHISLPILHSKGDEQIERNPRQ